MIQVSSPEEEGQVRLAAKLKEMAIGRLHGLPALSFEEALAEDTMQTPRPKIQEAVLKPFRVARAAARELLLGVEAGSVAASLIEQRKQIYTAMDTTFVVEVATAKALAGIAGQRLLERLALGVMPSEWQERSLQQCALELTTLAGKSLFRMTSRSAQASVTGLREVIDTLMSGSAPSWPIADASQLMLDVKQRSLWFASWAAPDLAEDGKPSLRGRQAVHACAAWVKKRFDDGQLEALTLQGVELLHVHAWLLGAETAEALKQWAKQLVARVGTLGACGSAGAPCKRTRQRAKATTESNKRTKEEANEEETQKAMAFFA